MHARTHARAVKTGLHQLAQPFFQSVVSNFAFTRRFKDPPPAGGCSVAPAAAERTYAVLFFYRANARFPFFKKEKRFFSESLGIKV
jgi:hypothetical protein